MRRSPARPPPNPDCPLEACLKILSGAWSAKIFWFLREGPRRFGDLRRDLGTVSPKVLTQKLRALEKAKLVRREVLPTAPPTVEYSLTPHALAISPVLDAMEQAARKLTQVKS